MKALHLMASGSVGGIEMLMRDFTVKSKLENVFLFVWELGCAAEEIRGSGAEVLFLDGGKLNTIEILKKLYKISTEGGFDVVVAHHEAPVFKMDLLLLHYLRPGIKTVAYSHSNAQNLCDGDSRIKNWLIKKIHSLGFRKANCSVAISDSVRQSLISELGVPDRKIKVVYNAVNLQRYELEPHLFDGTCHLIYVGRLIEEKGVQVTIEVLKDVSRNLSWDFTVIGDGPYRSKLEILTRKAGLEDRITFLGSRTDVPELLSKADIFIHLCICQEGFGIGLAEAMAAGKLCIGAQIGAIPEIIDDGINGYLVRTDDLHSVSKLLEEIILNPSAWATIQKAAKQKALLYDVEEYVSKFDSILQNPEQ